MARHRKGPAPRPQAHGPEPSPASPEAPDRRLGSVMRRVVVTPTFAAGLGVVVAAVLASQMSTVFSYVSPGALGPGGMRCGQLGCTRPSGKPVPEGGGVRNPAPAAAKSGGTDADDAAGQPQLSYRIAGHWQGGFSGLITIRFPARAVPAQWRLWFGYPSGQIVSVRPRGHLQHGGHSAVVRFTDYTGRDDPPGGSTYAITVGVRGKPAPPAHCTFNGQTCHIG